MLQSQSTKIAQVRQHMASKNQFRHEHFYDFCNTILTKILKILNLVLCIPNPKFKDCNVKIPQYVF